MHTSTETKNHFTLVSSKPPGNAPDGWEIAVPVRNTSNNYILRYLEEDHVSQNWQNINPNITSFTGMSFHIWHLKYVGFFLHWIMELTSCSEMSVTSSIVHHVTYQNSDDHIWNFHFHSFTFHLSTYRYNLKMRK